MALRDIFWHQIPPTRVGVFSGRMKCPCEVQFWDTMDRYLQNGRGKTLVDVGCGPGIKALTLALAGFRVIGYDVRDSAIRHARENLRQVRECHPETTIDADFFPGDIQDGFPDIADASVDVVVFVEVIEHIEQYDAVLQEIHRILVPNGQIVVTTPNKHFEQNTKEDGEHVYGEKAYGHVREFDLDELTAVMRRHGFTPQSQGHLNPGSSTRFCRWLHPWMIRDHGFLQGRAHIDDVIGIRTLGFLQPVYNLFFPCISWLIGGYNTLVFPLLSSLAPPSSAITHGKNLYVVAAKA